MTKQQLDTIETELVIEALTLASARHDAYARFRDKSPSSEQHQRKAKQMRELRERLCEEV